MVLRSKMQIWHGSADTTINLKNYQEQLKQGTNVFGVRMTPMARKPDYLYKKYVLSDYGLTAEGIYATGDSVPHNWRLMKHALGCDKTEPVT